MSTFSLKFQSLLNVKVMKKKKRLSQPSKTILLQRSCERELLLVVMALDLLSKKRKTKSYSKYHCVTSSHDF